jgi:hypothetical protein
MKTVRPLSVFLAATVLGCTGASAELPAPPSPREANYTRLVTLLGLDVARADLVVAILEHAHARVAEAREQIGEVRDVETRALMNMALQAIHQELDRQLSAVLSETELARVRQELPAPPQPTRGFTSV